MNKKEQMICEIARIYKGMTVAEFERRFAGMTGEELEEWLRKEKAMSVKKGVELC